MEIKILASGSAGNAYVISDGMTTLLLDAGIPFMQIQKGMNYQTSQIAACLVTHRHGDHAKAVRKLLGRGIPVYGPSDLSKEWYGIVKELWVSNKKDTKRGWYTVSESFEVMPFPVHHDVECLGFLIASTATGERLLYMTDTAYTEYTFEGVTHIMIEANHSQETVIRNAKKGVISEKLAERIMRSHMSIETVLGMLAANDTSKLKQVYLLHLSDGNSDAEDFKRRVQEATGAEVYVA